MASQTLAGLIARLQQARSVAQGRIILLDYARKSCGARLGLLFVLDRERGSLMLLEQSGRYPHPSSFSPTKAMTALPPEGLFASALEQRGLLDISDITRHPLSLPPERAWAWPHGRVLLHGLRQEPRPGVLVLCFGPAGARAVLTDEARDELAICVSLLGAYLGGEREFQAPRTYSEPPSARPKSPRKRRRIGPGAAAEEQLEERERREREAAGHSLLRFEEVVSLLTALCELGLTTGNQADETTFAREILRLLTTTLHAPTGYLWHYQARQQRLLLQSSLGDTAALSEFVTAEVNRLVDTLLQTEDEPAYGLITLPETETAGQVLAWQSLTYRARLLGMLGLVLPQEPVLLLDQRLLLNAAADIIALLLLAREQRRVEQQELIEQERSRIACEMHDSVLQDVTHVMQKIDYIERVLEKQPQTAHDELTRARDLLDRSLRDLRAGIASLLPASLEERGIDEALKALLREFRADAPHIALTYDVDELARWPRALQAPIYRFLQEALNNIRRHAGASEVHIRIHAAAGLGLVQISDNGQGFQPARVCRNWNHPEGEATALHMGLQTMEERVRQAGGVLEILSRPGAGTVLKARFALAQPSTELTARERDVLRLLVEGLTNRAIAARLSISLETVKSHVHHIMQKMQVKDRTQAAVVAMKQHWL